MFSVIMPVWNRAQVVGTAVESILAQTFTDYELLIVDDGSDDDLEKAVGPYLSDRVRFYRRPHLGAAAARNFALAQSDRPFVAYLDSDNRWRPDFLAVMGETLRRGDLPPQAAHCLARRLRRDPRSGRIYQDGLIGGPFDVADILEHPQIDLNAFVHSRRCLASAGLFDEGLKRLIDWDLMLRIFSCVEPCFVPRVLVDYYSGVHRPTISDSEDDDLALAQIWSKHEALRQPVRLVHDTIAYTWDRLPARKLANWIRSRQPSPLGDEGESRLRPFILQVEPTNRCNLACANCPRAERDLRRPPRDLRLEEFRAVVDDLEDSLLLLILWDWGEPFLNRDLPRMVRYATERDIRTVTSTNGHLLEDEPYTKALLAAGLSALIVAVDSVEQESYARFRKGGTLDRILAGIERLVQWKRSSGSPTVINMRTVVTRHNEHRLEDLRKLALHLGVDHFSVKTLNPTVDTEFKDSELAPLTEAYRRYAYVNGSWMRRRKSSAPCHVTSGTANIHSNGDLVPCSYDFDGSMKIGNVFEQPASRLWNGPAFRQCRRAVNLGRDGLERCRCCNVNFELASGSWFVTSAQSAIEIEATRPPRGTSSPAERLLQPPGEAETRLQRGVQERDETIRVLLSSRSWRLTRPVRSMLDAAQIARWHIGGRRGDRPATGAMYLPPPLPLAPRDWRGLADEMAEAFRQERLHGDLDAFLGGPGRLVLPAHPAPEISVLLVLHNRAALTFACLRALKTWIDAPYEVVIVDDGSTDETGALLARLDGARLLRNPRALGFARACNQAAAEARGATLLLLSQDAVLRPEAVAAARRALSAWPDAGAVGVPCLAPDGTSVIERGIVYDTGRVVRVGGDSSPDGSTCRGSHAVDFATRAFLMTPRDLWERIGGLDEAFADGPYTEVDYCFRLRRSGRVSVFVPEAAVVLNTESTAPDGTGGDEESIRTRFQARHLETLADRPPDPRGDRGYAQIESGSSSPLPADSRPRVEVYWHFNEACNFRCSYCFRSGVDRFRGQEHPACGRFEPEEMAARFDESGLSWKVVFTGGEPLLAPRFVEISRALALRHRIALNTNLSTDVAFAFAEAVPPERVHEIYASLHPVERDRVEGDWARFIERFHHLQRRGFPIRAVYVTHPALFDRMERDLETLRGRGVERISLKVFRGLWEGLSYPAAYTAQRRELMERIGLTPLERWVLANDFRLHGSLCGAGYRAFHMDPFGYLTRCNTVTEGYGNLLLGRYRLDDYPSPCPAASCGCPYQGFKYAGDGAFGEPT